MPVFPGDDDFHALEEGFVLPPSNPMAAQAAAKADEVFADAVTDFAGE